MSYTYFHQLSKETEMLLRLDEARKFCRQQHWYVLADDHFGYAEDVERVIREEGQSTAWDRVAQCWVSF